jgi:hypothetical protein
MGVVIGPCAKYPSQRPNFNGGEWYPPPSPNIPLSAVCGHVCPCVWMRGIPVALVSGWAFLLRPLLWLVALALWVDFANDPF